MTLEHQVWRHFLPVGWIGAQCLGRAWELKDEVKPSFALWQWVCHFAFLNCRGHISARPHFVYLQVNQIKSCHSLHTARALRWNQLVRQKCQKAAHEKWISRTLLLDILAKANSPVWIGLSGEKPGSCFTRIRVQGNFPPRVMASLSLTHYIQISTTLI